jgi:hypothetical protein
MLDHDIPIDLIKMRIPLKRRIRQADYTAFYSRFGSIEAEPFS